MEMPNVSITCLEIARDCSKLIAGNSAGFFCYWECEGAQVKANQQIDYGVADDFKPVLVEEAHPGQYILKCKLSPNKKFLATCSSDRSCKIWEYNSEIDSFTLYQTLSGHGGWVWDCDFSLDCVFCLTVSTDQTIRIWKIDEAKVKKVIKGHTKGITCLAFKD